MPLQRNSREFLVPSAPSRAQEVIAGTTRFCREHLDDEYGALCIKLIRRLARKRPSPFNTGEIRVWVGAVLYTLGQVNFLFDSTQRPHMRFDELSRQTGVSKSALATKARLIMNLLRIMPLEPDYCRQEILTRNPLAWMVEVNGILVDARTLSVEVQVDLTRRGLIPQTPASTCE